MATPVRESPPAILSGRVLADLITERDTDLTRLPMTVHEPLDWEPEPIRWLGYKVVRRARYKSNDEVERTGQYPEKPSIGQRLWSFEPPKAWRTMMRMDVRHDT